VEKMVIVFMLSISSRPWK